MRVISITVIYLILTGTMTYGQISTREEPVSFGTETPAVMSSDKTLRVTPALDMARIVREDLEDEARGAPQRIGYGFKVNYTLCV